MGCRAMTNTADALLRARWRSYRSGARHREEEADAADREAEKAEAEAAEAAAKRAAEQAVADSVAHADAQRAAGVLLPADGSHAPLKLKVAPKPAAGEEQPAAAAVIPKAVLGEAEEEDLGRRRLRKIELGDGLSDEKREETIKQHAPHVERELPRDREGLFAATPAWDWIDEVSFGRPDERMARC